MSEHKSIAVILARGGSKRLPGKNIKSLAGKSLIARAVETALYSKIFDAVIVSTDDVRIRTEAMLHGASAPFLRPAELSSDEASSLDALLHAVEYHLEHNKTAIENVCLIQPTSPFLRPNHLQEALNQFNSKGFTSLSSMVKVKFPPEWMFTMDEEKDKALFENPEMISKPTSELKKRYVENGAIYFVKLEWLLDKRSLYDANNHSGYVMSELDSIDIDTNEDWQYAKYIFNV